MEPIFRCFHGGPQKQKQQHHERTPFLRDGFGLSVRSVVLVPELTPSAYPDRGMVTAWLLCVVVVVDFGLWSEDGTDGQTRCGRLFYGTAITDLLKSSLP